MKKSLLYLLILLVITGFSGCQNSESDNPIKIALSRAVPEEKYQNYFRWLKSVDTNIIFLDMYHLSFDSALALLNECDGLLLTGGEDVYPGRFDRENDTGRCTEIDLKRDTLEFALLSKAIERKMPVQGVCRGLQLINVYFGGSLIIDIPTDLDTVIKHQLPDTYNCLHHVDIKKGSWLHKISGISKGITNSNHHQGIDVLGTPLEENAVTKDGLIEAIGIKDRSNFSYLFAVQWHPERLEYGNPLSGPIAREFIREVKSFSKK
jgi:putative glutamine amidotransferase